MRTTATAMNETGEHGPPGSYGSRTLGRAVRFVAYVGGVATILAWLADGTKTATGVACGAVLAVANLWAFARVASAFVERHSQAISWGVVALMKMIALFALAYVLMKRDIAHPLALAIGYFALPAGIVAAQLFGPQDPDSVSPSSDSTS